MFAAWLIALSLGTAPKCEVYFSFQGPFSAQAEWLVNRINAPYDVDKGKPPDVAIAPEVLAALNAAALPAIERAVTKRGRTACLDTFKGPPPVKKLSEGARPTQLALHVAAGGFDDVGGQYSGTQVRVQLWTLGRTPDLVGRASKRVTALDSVKAAQSDLDAVLATALDEAETSLDVALTEDASAASRTLVVTLDFYSLDRGGAQASIALMPCFVKVGGALAHAPTHPMEKNTQTFEVRYKTTESAERFVQRFADAIRSNTGSHGKYRCSLFRTALAGREVKVMADPAKGAVRVQLVKR